MKNFGRSASSIKIINAGPRFDFVIRNVNCILISKALPCAL